MTHILRPSLLLTLLCTAACALAACTNTGRTAVADSGVAVDRGAKDTRPTDAPTPDAAGQDARADITTVPDLPPPDVIIPDTLPPDLVPPPNTIGPAGGKAKSADGKAEIVVPAGALTKAVTFTLAAAASAPGGALGQAYTVGPPSMKLLKPALVRLTYDKSKLAGALEASIKLGLATAGNWQPRPSSHVDPVSDRVSGLTLTTGTFAPLSGGAQADVAKVLAVPPRPGTAAGLSLGAPGGNAPLLGVALDAAGNALKGALLTFHSDKPQVLTADQTSGMLTAKALSSPPNKELVKVTIKPSGVSSTTVIAVLPVTVVPRTKTTVNMVGAFSVRGVGAAGEAPLPQAKISLVGATGGAVTADSNGALSALPLLYGASYNTLRVYKSAAHLESHIALVAPAVDQPGQSGTYRLYEAKLLPATLCGVVPRHAGLGAILITAPPKGGGQGWTYEVTSPGALVRYLDGAWSPDCTLDSSGASGRALAINLAPGARWVLARKGTTVLARLVQVPSGAALAPVRFDD